MLKPINSKKSNGYTGHDCASDERCITTRSPLYLPAAASRRYFFSPTKKAKPNIDQRNKSKWLTIKIQGIAFLNIRKGIDKN